MPTLTIPVTQDHIDQGIRFSVTASPLALAALDAGASGAWSTATTIGIEKGRWCYERRLPLSVQRWIATYDLYRNGPQMVQPFDLVVDVDDWPTLANHQPNPQAQLEVER